jgi:hypothetical protein
MGQLIRRGLQKTDAKSEEPKSRPLAKYNIICRGYECHYFLGYSAQYNVLCDGQNPAIKKICYCPVQLYHVYSPHNYVYMQYAALDCARDIERSPLFSMLQTPSKTFRDSHYHG